MEQESVKTTKSPTTNVNVRLAVEEKKQWQAEAEEVGLNLSDFLRRIKEEFEPFDPFIETGINKISQGLGLDVKTYLSLCHAATLARFETEIDVFGEAAFNPFVISPVEDWEHLFNTFKENYKTSLYANELGAARHERFIESQRNDLLKQIKNFPARKKAAKKRAAREKIEKSEQEKDQK